MKKLSTLLVLFLFNTLIIKASTEGDTSIVETKITLQTQTGEIFGTVITPKKFGQKFLLH